MNWLCTSYTVHLSISLPALSLLNIATWTSISITTVCCCFTWLSMALDLFSRVSNVSSWAGAVTEWEIFLLKRTDHLPCVYAVTSDTKKSTCLLSFKLFHLISTYSQPGFHVFQVGHLFYKETHIHIAHVFCELTMVLFTVTIFGSLSTSPSYIFFISLRQLSLASSLVSMAAVA